jgi:hypothetical protein
MEETVLSGRVSRSRAWRICSAVMAGGPAEARAAAAGGVHALAGAFDDQLADELGQRGEDMEDQPTARGGGVECLVQALEADPPAAQRGNDGDQVGQRPGQPVVQAGGQLRPVGVLAGQLVGEHAKAAGAPVRTAGSGPEGRRELQGYRWQERSRPD